MHEQTKRQRVPAAWRAALGLATLVAVSAHAAPAALRAYATEWNAEAQSMTSAQKERLVDALLARWEAAALRFDGDAKTWRDTFGLQLSMLPGSMLAELAAVTPENGFQDIYARVAEALRSVAEKRSVRPKNLGQTTTDLVFVPINPCRIVDTRFGGGGFLSSGSPRGFVYANPSGGTFASQGGAGSNCGLAFSGTITPLSPRAIAATVTVVNASGGGNFVIYPTGTAPGATSALNYTAGAVLANSTVIVGAQGGATDFTVALNGPTHTADVIVDVIGYYYAPVATPLDCVTTTNTNSDASYPPGASVSHAVACTAGYQVTGGGCTFSNTDGSGATENTVLLHRSTRRFDLGTPLNEWLCQWTNTDPVKSFRFIARAMCCRVPGR